MEQLVIGLFLAFFLLEFLVEFLLNELNLRRVRARLAEQRVPEFFEGKIAPQDYLKSADYTLAKGRFQRWAQVYGSLVALFILFGGPLPS